MRKNYRKRKFNKKRKSTYKIFFLILVGMTVGFAAINTTLQLIGTLNISKTTWDIHFENPTKTGGVNATKEVALKENDNTTVEYQVKLENPGDYYEFTVDAKNDGTIDAMITGISNKVYENNVEVNPTYLESTITYANGTTIANNHLLEANGYETYKVRVEYKTGLYADQLPDSEKTYNYRFTVTYMQADDSIPIPADFSTDSWDVIASHPRSPKYKVGDKRTITMDVNEDGEDETYHLMILNKTECNPLLESKTACGLVIGFEETLNITNADDKKMYYDDLKSGGWPASKMRVYLNNNIYNKIVDKIGNIIIDTKTVTDGRGQNTSTFEKVESIDKIYLPSREEVVGDSRPTFPEYEFSRKLDYYLPGQGDEDTEAKEMRKKYRYGTNTATYWWLRTLWQDDMFSVILNTGEAGACLGISVDVSPVFRIG